MSLGLAAYRALAGAAQALDALRAGCAPGSDAWVALTDLVLALEGLLEALVEGDALEDEEERRMPKGRTTRLTIRLTPQERRTLESWQAATSMPLGLVRRGRILLLVADGLPITQVAHTVGISRRFVYKWVQRFQAQGTDGLRDLPRRRRFPVETGR